MSYYLLSPGGQCECVHSEGCWYWWHLCWSGLYQMYHFIMSLYPTSLCLCYQLHHLCGFHKRGWG